MAKSTTFDYAKRQFLNLTANSKWCGHPDGKSTVAVACAVMSFLTISAQSAVRPIAAAAVVPAL
jgi:hypothetical protein